MFECLRKPSVLVLILCQMLGISVATIIISSGGKIGLDLSGDPRWSTLPITAYVLGTFVMLFPASKLSGRYGRRFAFIIGSIIGIFGGLIFYLGIESRSLFWVCAGTLMIGFQRSFVEYYRFAVVELVSDSARAFGMSLVISGGVFAAFFGPNLARISHDFHGFDFLRHDFSATAVAIMLICLLQFSLFLLVYRHQAETVPTAKETQAEKERIDANIAQLQNQQSKGGLHSKAMGLELRHDYRYYILMAMMITAAGSAIMTFLMNAAPIAMQHEHGLSFDLAAQAVQWHVFAMYFPSFFTGFLLKKFQCLPLAFGGLVILALSAITGIIADTHLMFSISLILLGIGWNLCYFTGSYLLVQVTPKQQKANVQGINDTGVFALNFSGALLAGVAVSSWGWSNSAQFALGVIIIITVIAIARNIYLQPQKL
ncbi:MAG: MFS transporter [Alphaproteobacteria bacterium]|nr:MFS transporter [Alphaproteobacteria bacterium]